MIFQHTFEAVLAGEKTMTRRRVRPGHMFMRSVTDEIWDVQGRKRLVYAVGHSYAVQPAYGASAVGRIILDAIYYCPVAVLMSAEHAQMEGFDTPEEWHQVWARMYGPRALDLPCWSLQFHLDPASLALATGLHCPLPEHHPVVTHRFGVEFNRWREVVRERHAARSALIDDGMRALRDFYG